MNYNNPYIINDFDPKLYFDINDINNSNNKLLLTNKGVYSITKYDDAQWITESIYKYLSNISIINIDEMKTFLYKYNIIDTTACVGGNTLNFCKYFFNIFSIELNNIHFNVLKNNINVCNYNNVKLYNGNFIDILKKEKIISDIVFIDPPWGGFKYKSFKYFNLKLGNIPIDIIISNLLINFKYVVLKAPFNINVNILVENIKYSNISIFKNNKNNLLLIIFSK